ncbi:ELF3-like protein 2 isoform X2 [Andrographis paniculata]|uniref:ELF3-like protein 2 isoform X2 n=1 Tax=Andrographis paniculata TaxID=175694 RepID=UPI0021E9295D|nr:ELF3-like protein 2 isoform X2 [Andrographis paniculata]
MKGRKDEGNKPMDPMFPRLHISDADKGGPRAPPRNKMALCEQYNVVSQSSKSFGSSGSPPLLPFLPSSGGSTFLSRSSSNEGGDKGQALPTSGSMPTFCHLPERYYSQCQEGAIPSTILSKSEPWLSLTESYNLRAPDESTSKDKCNDPPRCSESPAPIPGDKNSFKSPFFFSSGRNLNYGKLHLNPGSTSCSSVSSGENHNVFLKLPRIASRDCAAEESGRLSQDSESCSERPCRISLFGAKNFSDTSLAQNKSAELGIRKLRSDQLLKTSLGDEQTMLQNPCKPMLHDLRVLQKDRALGDAKSGIHETSSRKRSALAMNDSSCKTKIDSSKDFFKGAMPMESSEKKQDFSDSTEASGSDLDISPDEVAAILGQRLFWRARKTIVHQQRVFSLQIFELHRLVQVQRRIARSPEMSHESNFDPKKQSMQFSRIDKLPFMTPLDPLPSKSKVDVTESDTDKDCKAEDPTGDAEKGHFGQEISLKSLIPMLPSMPTDAKLSPLPVPASVPTDAKLAPWCFPPSSGNPWLVPVRPPYSGTCFPNAGLMAPVHGNCAPMNLSAVGGVAYGVPPNQNYLHPYSMPAMDPNSLNLDREAINNTNSGFQLAGSDKNLSSNVGETPCKVSSDLGSKNEGETLPLFPTMPSCEMLNDESEAQATNNESKVQVIKVVPHSSSQLAAESAARIFQSLIEERKRA